MPIEPDSPEAFAMIADLVSAAWKQLTSRADTIGLKPYIPYGLGTLVSGHDGRGGLGRMPTAKEVAFAEGLTHVETWRLRQREGRHRG